jgi:ABC-type phosphate/phosphonate transport system substrate-binding protein
MRLHRVIPLLLLRLLAGRYGPLAEAQPAASVKPGAGPGEPRHARLYGVATGSMFTSTNRNDARAALTVWYSRIGQQRGFVLDTRVDIVDTVAEIRERLDKRSADLISMGVADYLELESSGLLIPVLTDARSPKGGPQYSYVLLINSASRITSIADLRGKNLMVSMRGERNTVMAWLEVLLGKEKLGRSASFFASTKMTVRAQACILPLFFGAVDACLVDEVNLDLAKEMNPQLSKLRVLARSRPMIESVIALPSDPRLYQSDLVDAMLALHDTPQGRQLLMVFGTDHLVRIQPGDLDSSRELWKDYYRLPGSPSRRAPDPAAENGSSGPGRERD